MFSRTSNARIVVVWPILFAVLLLATVTGCSKKARSEKAQGKGEAFAKAGEYNKAEVEFTNSLRNNPNNAASSRGLGAIHLEQGRYGTARILLERARELDSADTTSRSSLAELTFRVGDKAGAQKQALAVLENNPADPLAPIILAETVFSHADATKMREQLEKQSATNPSAALFVAIGTLQFRQGQLDAASASALRAVALDPKSHHARLLQGALALARKDRTAAEEFFKQAADLAPRRSIERMALANFKMDSGDLAAAKVILEGISQEIPDNLPVLVKLAELAAREKRYEDSAALLEKVLTRDRTYPSALLLSGWLNIARGDSAKAVAAAERSVGIFPKVPVVHHQLGLALLASNQPGKAADSLRQACMLDPTFVEPALLLARLQAERMDHDQALTTLRTLLKFRPDNFQTQVQLADTLRQKGAFPEALAVLQKMEKEFTTVAQLPWNIGVILLQQNKFPEARKALTQALALDPTHRLALEQLVNLDLAEKQPAKAASRVAEFRRTNPQAVEIDLLQAKIHLAQGQTAEAERTLLDLLKARPDSQPVLKFLAETYIRSRRGGQAIPYLEKIITLAPGDLEALYMLGSLQSDAGRLAEARTAYEKFLTIERNNGVVLNNLASVYTQLGELDRAEDSARKAREYLPPSTQGNAADTLGWVLYKKRAFSQALILFQEACTKLPQYPDHHFHLGLAHYALGQGDLARPLFEKAVQMQPTAPWRAEAQQMIALVELVSSGKEPEMLAALNGALEKNPDDLFALRALANLKKSAGAYVEAAELLKRALQRQTENVTLLVDLAELHAYSLKSLPPALEYAKAAQKIAADDLRVAAITGRIAYLAGEHPWAVSLLRRAGRDANVSLETRLHLAEAEYAVGAVSAAKEVLEQISRDPRPNLRRDEVLRFLKLIGLAQAPAPDKTGGALVSEVLLREPNHLAALAAAGNLALADGKPSVGSKHLETALKMYPDFTPGARALAGIYVWDDAMQDRAFELATKSLAAAPSDASLEGILGVLNCRRGDYKKARQQLLAGLTANRDDPRLVFYLGMAELGLKNAEGARTSLTRALSMPGLPPAMEIEARDVLDNRLSMLMHEAALAK